MKLALNILALPNHLSQSMNLVLTIVVVVTQTHVALRRLEERIHVLEEDLGSEQHLRKRIEREKHDLQLQVFVWCRLIYRQSSENTSCPKNNQLDTLQYFQPFSV